jgi:hypothetical protein
LRAIRLKKAGKGALPLFPFTFEQEVGRPALGLENVIFICSSRLCGGESFGGSPSGLHFGVGLRARRSQRRICLIACSVNDVIRALLGEDSLLGELVVRVSSLRAQTAVGPLTLCRGLSLVRPHHDCQ